MELSSAIVMILTAQRRHQKISQTAMAGMINTKQSTMSRLESEKQTLTVDVFAIWCKALSLDMVKVIQQAQAINAININMSKE